MGRKRSPNVEGGPRRIQRTARLLKGFHQQISTALVEPDHFRQMVRMIMERPYGGPLDGLKDTGVHVRLYLGQR